MSWAQPISVLFLRWVGNDIGLNSAWIMVCIIQICILTRELGEFTMLHEVLQLSLLSIVILIIVTSIINDNNSNNNN